MLYFATFIESLVDPGCAPKGAHITKRDNQTCASEGKHKTAFMK